MKQVIRMAMLLGATACIFSLFGCGKKHIQDGPGMINDLNWKNFTVSRSDSYAQYNFSFTVEQKDTGFFLTGECRDDQGNEYNVENGIRLSATDVRYLRTLNVGNLPDVLPNPAEEDGELLLLDAPVVTLFVTYLDGVEQEKAVSVDLSFQFYERFLHYFINQ